MANDSTKTKSDPSRHLRGIVTFGALLVALIHLLWPTLAIDAITLVLIMLAVVPWLAPVFKSLEFPGGWKFEFQELQDAAARAQAAGLLAGSPPQPAAQNLMRFAYMDPNLALAWLRIEIEKRLV